MLDELSPMRDYSELIQSKTRAIAAQKTRIPLEKIFHNVKPTTESLYSQISKRKTLSIILELNSDQCIPPQESLFPGVVGFSLTSEANPDSVSCSLPKIHNDLILEPYQIYQSRFLGFNLLPLYIGSLEESELLSLFLLARQLGMGAIFSVSNQKELEKAISSPANFIGLDEVDYFGDNLKIDQICEMAEEVPEEKFILTRLSEAKIQDIDKLSEAEINAVTLPCPETSRKLGNLKRRLAELPT